MLTGGSRANGDNSQQVFKVFSPVTRCFPGRRVTEESVRHTGGRFYTYKFNIFLLLSCQRHDLPPHHWCLVLCGTFLFYINWYPVNSFYLDVLIWYTGPKNTYFCDFADGDRVELRDLILCCSFLNQSSFIFLYFIISVFMLLHHNK